MTDIKLEFDSTAVCRICLQASDEEMISIYERDSSDNTVCLYEKIEKCGGIKILTSPELPSQICTKCNAFLNLAHKFRTICKHSDSYLREFVCKTVNDATTTPINDGRSDCEDVDIYYLDENLQESRTNATPTRLHQQYANENIGEDDVEYEELNEYAELNNWEDDDDDDDDEDDFIIEDMHTDGENSNTWSTPIAPPITTTRITPATIAAAVTAATPTPAPTARSITTTTTQIPTRKGRTTISLIPANTTKTAKTKTLDITSDGAAIIRERSERVLSTKEVHICEVCGNSYPRKYALEVHMRRHTNEKPFECELCGQAFHFNFQLTRHIRKHTGARPYTCQYCKRKFTDRSTMVKHERIHRNERPYTCETCGKSFTYSSVLKVHTLTHTGEKPFNCGICGKRFGRAHHLRAHLETLLHQSDPRAKELLKLIKREEDNEKSYFVTTNVEV